MNLKKNARKIFLIVNFFAIKPNLIIEELAENIKDLPKLIK